MAQRFQQGQRVRLVNKHTVHGAFGIPPHLWGLYYEVLAVYSHEDCEYAIACQEGAGAERGVVLSVFDSMLTWPSPSRTSGVLYRVIGKGWSEQVFASDTLTTVADVWGDLIDQVGGFNGYTYSGDSSLDRITGSDGELTALRVA